jgi:3-isopropylmalate dehydratase small subunit
MDSGNSRIIHFEVESTKKRILLDGLDEIEITLQYEPYITEYENRKCTKI